MGTVEFALFSWFSIVRDVWRQQFSVLSKKTNNISVVSSHFHLYLRISALRLPTVRLNHSDMCAQIAGFMGPTRGPPGSCRPQGDPCWSHEPCYLRNKFQWHFNRNSSSFIKENALESVCEMASILSRRRCSGFFWRNVEISLRFLVFPRFWNNIIGSAKRKYISIFNK